ncbi:MAG: microcystin degradation protein MlrC, partial [Spirochaetia bacterium]|nr:microcystin degradation protein MlrC [Spirochaetia bacterium]
MRVSSNAPVVISDSGDNPTAGGSGDVTNFLALMLNNTDGVSLEPPALYQCFYDPFLVQQAFSLGQGAVFDGSLGSCFDPKKSSPIQQTMQVKALKSDWDGNKVDLALI